MINDGVDLGAALTSMPTIQVVSAGMTLTSGRARTAPLYEMGSPKERSRRENTSGRREHQSTWPGFSYASRAISVHTAWQTETGRVSSS